jgi:hypothetical protein
LTESTFLSGEFGHGVFESREQSMAGESDDDTGIFKGETRDDVP